MRLARLFCICLPLLFARGTALRAQSSGEPQTRKAAAPQDASLAPAPGQSVSAPAKTAPIPATAGGAPAARPAAVPKRFVLEDGTPVRLELTRDLSSAEAKAGDRVDFQVLDDVKVDSSVVVPMGGIAWAKITEAQHKRHLGRGGKLDLAIDTVRLADGEKIGLRSVKEARGGGHVGAMTAGIAATAIVFFPAAPFLLFVEGKDITIPEGTEITAYVDGDFELDPAKFPPETPENETARHAEADAKIKARRERNTVSFDVKSAPDGASIYVDGKLVGKTPLTLPVRIGKHKFKLEKHGYESWDDVVDVSSKTTTSISVSLSKK